MEEKKQIVRDLIKKHDEEFNKFPRIDWISREAGFTKSEVKEALMDIADDGDIKPKAVQYDVPSRIKKKKKTKQVEKKNSLESIVLIVIRILLIFVSLVTTYLSVYYSYLWFDKFHNEFRAIIFAAAWVIFAVVSFELILLFRKKWYFVVLFIATWLITASFSMYCTVAGQYSVLMEEAKQSFEVKEGEALLFFQYDSLKSELDMIDIQMRSDLEKINMLTEQLGSIRQEQYETIDEYKSAYWTTNYGLNRAREDFAAVEERRSEAKTRFDIFMDDNWDTDFSNALEEEEISENIYVEIAKIISWSPEVIQFWSSAFPAVFIDIIAPLSLAVVLFARRKKKYV